MADSEARIYLVCDACGYFYGDSLLLELAPVCEQCGEQRAWAFPTIELALIHSETIKASRRETREFADWYLDTHKRPR